MDTGPYNGILRGGFHDPVEIICSYAVPFRIRRRIAEVDGIGDTIADGQFHRIKVVAQRPVNAQDDLFHLQQSFRRGSKISAIPQMVWITWLIRHNAGVFAPDAITPVIFGEDDLLL